jgi:iron complex outermembrane recepter protein
MNFGIRLFVAGMLVAATSHAQDHPDIIASDVVVTATRFEETAASQPIGVQVIDADHIRDSGARTLPELLSYQPGIVTRDNSGNPNRQIDMRGFGSFGDQNTLVLVDGQRISENEQIPANLSSIPLSSIERVEIVHGGGGAVMYGGGATGGTINVITRSPRPGAGDASLRAEYGSYDTRSFAAGATLSGDILGMSLDADRFESDNYRDNNQISQGNAQMTLRWQDDQGPISLKIGHSEQDLRLPGARTEAQLDTDRRGTSTPDDYSSLDADRITFSGTRLLSFGEIAVDAGYRTKRLVSVIQPGFIDTEGRTTAVSPRIKLPLSIRDHSNVLIAGVDWDRWDYDTSAFFGFSSDAASTQENLAYYLKDTIELTGSLLLSAGYREQRTDSTLEEIGFSPLQVQKRTLRAHEVALRKSFDSGWAFYAKTGESFRIPNVDDNRFRAQLLEPQTSHDDELGVELSGPRARGRLAVYRMRLNNEILFLPSTVLPPFGGNVNLPPTQREGLELEGEAQLYESLAARANYAWTDARFAEGNFGGTEVTGNVLPLVPRHRAGASLMWKPDAATALTARASYVGEQYFENDQSNTFGRMMPAYTIVDLIAGYRTGPWRLSAGIYNLLNKKYFTYGVVSGVSFVAYPAPERNFLLGLDYAFGK